LKMQRLKRSRFKDQPGGLETVPLTLTKGRKMTSRSAEILDWINRYGVLKECNERQRATIETLKKELEAMYKRGLEDGRSKPAPMTKEEIENLLDS